MQVSDAIFILQWALTSGLTDIDDDIDMIFVWYRPPFYILIISLISLVSKNALSSL